MFGTTPISKLHFVCLFCIQLHIGHVTAIVHSHHPKRVYTSACARAHTVKQRTLPSNRWPTCTDNSLSVFFLPPPARSLHPAAIFFIPLQPSSVLSQELILVCQPYLEGTYRVPHARIFKLYFTFFSVIIGLCFQMARVLTTFIKALQVKVLATFVITGVPVPSSQDLCRIVTQLSRPLVPALLPWFISELRSFGLDILAKNSICFAEPVSDLYHRSWNVLEMLSSLGERTVGLFYRRGYKNKEKNKFETDHQTLVKATCLSSDFSCPLKSSFKSCLR